MANPEARRAFLLGEIEGLEPFDLVALIPVGQGFHVVEATRTEAGGIEVRVPGRPPIIPALSSSVRSALQERGFASEDSEDPTRPWVCAAESGEAAVKLVEDVLIHVFGGKPDAKLDVAHGSHRAEYEARQKLAVARTRIETILTDLLGQAPNQDNDGDYVLPVQEVHVMVAPRAAPNGQIVVRVFAIAIVGVTVTPDLGLFLARLNFGLMFGRFALDAEHRAIWFDETLLGEQFREEELRFAIDVVAKTADEWDDRLKQMFGGVTYQEVLAGRSAESAPPTKPGAGSGTGLYL